MTAPTSWNRSSKLPSSDWSQSSQSPSSRSTPAPRCSGRDGWPPPLARAHCSQRNPSTFRRQPDRSTTIWPLHTSRTTVPSPCRSDSS
jgi:hypothetical protein